MFLPEGAEDWKGPVVLKGETLKEPKLSPKTSKADILSQSYEHLQYRTNLKQSH